MKVNAHPTLALLLRTLALFAFLLVIWPAPPASQADIQPRASSGR